MPARATGFSSDEMRLSTVSSSDKTSFDFVWIE